MSDSKCARIHDFQPWLVFELPCIPRALFELSNVSMLISRFALLRQDLLLPSMHYARKFPEVGKQLPGRLVRKDSSLARAHPLLAAGDGDHVPIGDGDRISDAGNDPPLVGLTHTDCCRQC